MIVRELELDLDAFEGPFDLLLTLVLKEELDLYDVDVARIVLAFVEELDVRERVDLEATGEFLVLVAALLELKARALFPEEEAELSVLGPEEAAEELARRLEEYRRMKEAARWLRERLGVQGDRFFRLGLELGELGLLVGEERARLQLEQRGNQDEELAARLEIQFAALGQPLAERDDDDGHVHLGEVELLLQDQR